MRVLSALSQPSASAACADVFSSFGWDIDSTTDPSIAVRMLTFRRYDAIVTDLEFDDVSCTAGLNIVRASKLRGRRPVVVVLTTTASEEVMSEAHAAGADHVLLKPQRLDFVAAQLTTRAPAANDAAGDAK
jgi:DNA-binding response OmpR family regulator